MLLAYVHENTSAHVFDASDRSIAFEWTGGRSVADGESDVQMAYLMAGQASGRGRDAQLADEARMQSPPAEAGGPDFLTLLGAVFAEVMGADPAF
jgi:hypothetical protein